MQFYKFKSEYILLYFEIINRYTQYTYVTYDMYIYTTYTISSFGLR